MVSSKCKTFSTEDKAGIIIKLKMSVTKSISAGIINYPNLKNWYHVENWGIDYFRSLKT